MLSWGWWKMIVSCGENWWEVIATYQIKGERIFPPLYTKHATYKKPHELVLVESLVEFFYYSAKRNRKNKGFSIHSWFSSWFS